MPEGDQTTEAAVPAGRVPRGVRQAQQRRRLAEAGVHLRSRRNPKRLPPPDEQQT